MKAAAIYCRVSTAGQARDGSSLDTQVDACKALAQAQGYTIVEEFQEDASGGRLDRPGLDRIRDLAAAGHIQALICLDPDRLSRDLGHLMLLVDELERNRTELIFVNAPHENTPEGMMLLQMRGMFAQYERTKIRERTRRGKERRSKEGRVLASWQAPYGYEYVVGEGRFEILPQEAHHAAQIFEWYVVEGLSLRGIAARLTEKGVPTKRGAVCWTGPTIASILKNSVYKGRWYYNKSMVTVARKQRFVDGPKSRQEKSSSQPRPREEWIGVDVPAIVSAELFDAVAPRMERNARLAKRNCKADYLLRGLLICKQCGRRIGARHREGYYTQYHCTGHHDPELRATCKAPWPNAPKLDDRVWSRVAGLFSDEELIGDLLQAHGQMRHGEREREDADLTALLGSEQTIKSKEARYLDAYGNGAIDLSQLQEQMSLLRKQKEALATVRAELEQRIEQRDAVRAQQDTIKRLAAQAKRGMHLFTFEDKRAFLEAIKFRGIVDGETDKLYIEGLITSLAMSLSGKSDPPDQVGSGGERVLSKQYQGTI